MKIQTYTQFRETLVIVHTNVQIEPLQKRNCQKTAGRAFSS
jgi:hypothetical protein